MNVVRTRDIILLRTVPLVFAIDLRDILPHGSYLVNLATHDPTKRKRAYESFVDELKRCEALGIQRFNFQSYLIFSLANTARDII